MVFDSFFNFPHSKNKKCKRSEYESIEKKMQGKIRSIIIKNVIGDDYKIHVITAQKKNKTKNNVYCLLCLL